MVINMSLYNQKSGFRHVTGFCLLYAISLSIFGWSHIRCTWQCNKTQSHKVRDALNHFVLDTLYAYYIFVRRFDRIA
ncbi:hypothetical protein EV702DRAFT_1124137 [Suillus placidus]|uniref:Uncharacterized protein n=1 Tax=Suillus placidus TaxID=48579 RepID=A0A9P6ZQP6_9AGAM|nr:hypothetical protein EV702DRAFT_1124137 [Suillus placidus]